MRIDRNKENSGRFRKDLKRSCEFRQCGKLICICPEGEWSEYTYFTRIEKIFQKRRGELGKSSKVNLRLQWTKLDSASDPESLVTKIKQELKELRKRNEVCDSAWIISDYDGRKDNELDRIKNWVEENEQKRHWILSNKDFEQWLKYHFKDKGSEDKFFDRYYKHDKYRKKIKDNDFTYEQIRYACEKARAKKQNLDDLYTQSGSLMYKIIVYIGKEYGLCSEDSRGRVNWK